jgi:hypothetical protein
MGFDSDDARVHVALAASLSQLPAASPPADSPPLLGLIEIALPNNSNEALITGAAPSAGGEVVIGFFLARRTASRNPIDVLRHE